jgi:hypothetical protein
MDEPTNPVSAEVVEAPELTPEVSVKPKPKPPSRFGLPGFGGRRKGSKNKVTVQIREAATKLVSDPVYWRKLKADIRKRKVHPQMEALIWSYAFGKPIDRVEIGRVGDFSKLSDDELMTQFEEASKALRAVGRKALRSA